MTRDEATRAAVLIEADGEITDIRATLFGKDFDPEEWSVTISLNSINGAVDGECRLDLTTGQLAVEAVRVIVGEQLKKLGVE